MLRRRVWSPYGYVNGPVNSLVGKNESIINFNEGKASYVKKGKVGKDTEPSSVTESDDNVILGNDVNWNTGNTFANDAIQHTAKVEYLNNIEKKLSSKNSKMDSLYNTTSKLNNSLITFAKQAPMLALQVLSDLQKMQHEMENKYKMYEFDGGSDQYGMWGEPKLLPMPEPWYAMLYKQRSDFKLALQEAENRRILQDLKNYKPNFPTILKKIKQNNYNPIDILNNPKEDYTIGTESPKQNKTKWSLLDLFRKKNRTDNAGTVKEESDITNIPFYLRMIPHVLGLGTALGQYAHWKNEPIKYHSTYSRNPYIDRALATIAANRINPYNAVELALNAERRAAYRTNQSGGLTAGQRQKERIAGSLGTGRNIADILMNAQEKNAALRNQYAEAAAKYGDAESSRLQNARLHDWQDYVAAHGRKTKGIEQSLANLVGQAKDWYSNEFKYRAWKDTANMYNQKLNAENAKWAREYQMQKETADALRNSYANQYVPQQIQNNPLKLTSYNYTSPLDIEFYNKQLNVPNYNSLIGHNCGKNKYKCGKNRYKCGKNRR